MENKRLSEAEAAEALNISPRTLFRLRQAGIGPPFYDLKSGHGKNPLIRYDLDELLIWLKSTNQNSKTAAE